MALLRFSTIKNGKTQEQTLELTQNEIGIGRDPASTIVLSLDGVSRHHARIRKTDDGYLLMDKDSTNGVFLNEKKTHEHLLQHGDVFRIGTTSFHFQLTAGEESVHGEMASSNPHRNQKECRACGKSTRAENKFCPTCGSQLTLESRPPIEPQERSGMFTRGRVIAAIVVFALVAVTAMALLGNYFLTTWQEATSSTSTLARIAPELVPYGDLATLRGEPRTFTTGSEGSATTLSDGAVIEVPQGVLREPVTFQGAVIDLELQDQSADVTSARVYMVATETSTGPLSEPVVLEIPVAVSPDVIFAWHDGSDWLSFSVPEGPKARIQFHSFSRRYVAVVKGQKASAPTTGTAATAGARVDALTPRR